MTPSFFFVMMRPAPTSTRTYTLFPDTTLFRSYLRSYKFDMSKVDQSFMAGIHKSYGDRDIIQAVAQLARSLNMDTVAEGVETDDQLHYAREAGFTNVQGYLLRRPMTDDQVAKLLAEHHSGDRKSTRLNSSH